MPTPFRKLRDYFRPDDEEDERAELEQAVYYGQILDFAERPHFAEFCKWLDREASKPLEIGSDVTKMISSAVRANTFREIRSHLDREIETARAAVERVED